MPQNISEDRVRALVRTALPEYADAEISRFPSFGTVNALFRLGEDALVRIPVIADWADPATEAGILRVVAPALSCRVPRVLHLGAPQEGLASGWLVLEWIPGDPAPIGAGGAPLAADLSRLLRQLWTIPTTGARSGYRIRLSDHDETTRAGLAEASDLLDVPALLALWEDALSAPSWDRPVVWTHSDLLAGNVLVDEAGGLAAVLDWESAGVGDPACDLMSAWSMLDAGGRAELAARLPLDLDSWRRGRGWALLQAAIALPFYRDTNPWFREHSLHVLSELVRTELPHR